MKVEDLIKQLEAYPKNMKVYVWLDGWSGKCSAVWIGKDGEDDVLVIG